MPGIEEPAAEQTDCNDRQGCDLPSSGKTIDSEGQNELNQIQTAGNESDHQ